MIPVAAGQTWFVPRYNAFVYIHGIDGQYAVIGGLTTFENDSITNIYRRMVRLDILQEYVDHAHVGLDTEIEGPDSIVSGHVRVVGDISPDAYDDDGESEGLFEDQIVMPHKEIR